MRGDSDAMLKLAFEHGEITVDHGLFVAPGKGGPGIDAHGVSHLMAVHRRGAPDGKLVYAIAQLALYPQDVLMVMASAAPASLNWTRHRRASSAASNSTAHGRALAFVIRPFSPLKAWRVQLGHRCPSQWLRRR
jgi:hypothetical protein